MQDTKDTGRRRAAGAGASRVRPWAQAAAGLALCLGAMGAAQAARPMVTDDARVVDAQACQVESWVRRNHGSTEFWTQPGCNPTGNLELTVGGALRNEGGETRTLAQVLQAKTLFKTLEPNGWGAGLALGATRDPQGGTGTGWYAYVPLSLSLRDDRLVLHTNLGWTHAQGTGRDRATWGLGSEAQLAGKTWLIAETFSQGEGRPFYQVGLRHWLVPDRVQVDATYGNRWAGGGERWLSIGLRLLSPPFLP